ncbi:MULTISPECIES: TetR/AcrR family transcriptional regulator [Croceitalea]|uniref:TetR/AcrR family transcriptional regulator n=1 Tax=Croceitalea vernalis TaxID=3075599 RepID=A0ABU3BCF5_9FLAO|nr:MULTISPECIES: TetR/AcrR family transcriptional regulator [unclassified Croceitalea]MDT0538368.1 TetR/AcrR family transcriptional regulator [Croceitalea sp. P059]MDT0620151.1 TetR/AcrR family transcriptional regulator [Croceitalea sp. P007]
MERLLQTIKIAINEKIYLKDPESSDLGKRIIEHSILMIDDMGFESFTFKKLGIKIGSNESSIYRYFENKHKLLVYLTSWYWGWLEYQLVFATNSISDPKEKLTQAINIVTRTIVEDNAYSHINEVLLNKIVINESSKSFLTKEVDEENKDGYFVIYKRMVTRLEEMINAVNAKYIYPSSLASSILEGSLHQHFLKDHFQTLTNCDEENTPSKFMLDLVFKTIDQ